MFDAYGKLSSAEVSATEQSGRYSFQAAAERRILADIVSKLSPTPDDRLLEIGCGPGNLLIPLSFLVKEAIGIDHPSVVARGKARFRDAQVTWLEGQFPDVAAAGAFDCVLIYSVIQNLQSMAAVEAFLDAAVAVLPPGGRLLVGDIPSTDRNARFRSSDKGRAFEIEWRKVSAELAKTAPGADPFRVFEGVSSLGSFTDGELLALLQRYRAQGFNAYLLPQPADLPFGHTREDILVERP